MGRPVWIYCLKDPRSGETRYIGQTVNLHARYRKHCYPRRDKRTFRDDWVLSLRRAGIKPVLVVLQLVYDEQAADTAERWWIDTARLTGAALTNITPGGDTRPGEFTPEVLLRLRAANLGKITPPETRERQRLAALGRLPVTTETRVRLSHARRGRKARQGSSCFVGVSYDKRREVWRANLYHDKKHLHLGNFATEVEAARAFDAAARRLRGTDTRTNFLEGDAGEWHPLPTLSPAEKAKKAGAAQRGRKRRQSASSQYVGVSRRKQGSAWEANIRHEGHLVFLGRFPAESDAARAYDEAARRLRGPDTPTNFPEPVG